MFPMIRTYRGSLEPASVNIIDLTIFTTVPSIRVSRVSRYVRVTLPLLLQLGLVWLGLWLVSWIVLDKYRCAYGTLNSMTCMECMEL